MVLADVLEERLVDADAERGWGWLFCRSRVRKTSLRWVCLLAGDGRWQVVGVDDGKVLAGDPGSVFALDVDVQAAYSVKTRAKVAVVLAGTFEPEFLLVLPG